jgi:hypothetical protein
MLTKKYQKFFSEIIKIVKIKDGKIIKEIPVKISKFSDFRKLENKKILWNNKYIYEPVILRMYCLVGCRSFTDVFSLEDSVGTAFDKNGNGVDLRNQIYNCKKHRL